MVSIPICNTVFNYYVKSGKLLYFLPSYDWWRLQNIPLCWCIIVYQPFLVCISVRVQTANKAQNHNAKGCTSACEGLPLNQQLCLCHIPLGQRLADYSVSMFSRLENIYGNRVKNAYHRGLFRLPLSLNTQKTENVNLHSFIEFWWRFDPVVVATIPRSFLVIFDSAFQKFLQK